MPKSEVREEDPHKLPADTPMPAVLMGCEEHRFPIKSGKRAGEEFVKWTWTFKINDGEFKGLQASVDTDPKVTVTPDGQRNMAALIVEALREMPVEFGEGIDTDDYNGLPCVITCRHDKRERGDGQGFFYSEPVKDVFPASSLSELVGGGGPSAPAGDPWARPDTSEDPPF